MTFAFLSLSLAGMAAQAMAQNAVTFGFTPTSDCTMTIVSTTGAPLPPYGWKPTWTMTKHTATTTATETIDCAGCRRLLTATLIIDFYYPDAPRHVTVDYIAPTPTTAIEFQCGVPSFPIINALPTDVTLAGLLLAPPAPIAPAPPILGGPLAGLLPEPEPAVDPIQPGSIVLVDPTFPDPVLLAGPDLVSDLTVREDIGIPALPIVKRGRNKAACTRLLLEPPALTWGPTRTVWTKTDTYTETVECSGCPNLVHSILPLGVPPVVIFNATTTVDTASTTTVFECGETSRGPSIQSTGTLPEPTGMAPSTSQDPDLDFPELTKTVTPQGVLKPSCTTSTWLDPVIPDSTWTVYPGTVTSTTTVDCGSCELHWWTGVVYFFAPIIQTTTTTVDQASTRTAVACSAVTN
ncbi:hypothetical protein HJFPF1_05431 [Paramyrothecium foliicola]|nr:hypothetical protein HJFPF1_05431 [Paramyrothecium foliicola]